MNNTGIKVSALMCGKCKVELIGPMVDIHCPMCGYIPTNDDIQGILKQAYNEHTEEREQNEGN